MNKRILAMAMAVVCALTMLTACGSKEQSVPTQEPSFGADLTAFYNDIMNAAEEGPFMMDVAAEAEMLEMIYPGLKDIQTKQLVAFTPAMSAVAIEFAFVEVANADDVVMVQAIFTDRINNQVAGGAWYPESIEGWKNNSRIVSNGNYVMMIAWQYCDEAVSAFNALF